MAQLKTVRWALAAMAGAAVVTAWTGVGASHVLDAPDSVFVIAVIAAAIATEAAFWTVMFLLGWSAVANRHWLVRRFTGAQTSGKARAAEHGA